MASPVHEKEAGKWFFWDEVWQQRLGPFDSENEATVALFDYYRSELEGRDEDIPDNTPLKKPGISWEHYLDIQNVQDQNQS